MSDVPLSKCYDHGDGDHLSTRQEAVSYLILFLLEDFHWNRLIVLTCSKLESGLQ